MTDQITFTEAEVKRIADFMNFVMTRADFKISGKEMVDFYTLYKDMVLHLKKCEDHIMELKQVIEKPKDAE